MSAWLNYITVGTATLAAVFSALDLIVLSKRRERNTFLRDSVNEDYAGWLSTSFDMSSICNDGHALRETDAMAYTWNLEDEFDVLHDTQNRFLTRMRLWGSSKVVRKAEIVKDHLYALEDLTFDARRPATTEGWHAEKMALKTVRADLINEIRHTLGQPSDAVIVPGRRRNQTPRGPRVESAIRRPGWRLRAGSR